MKNLFCLVFLLACAIHANGQSKRQIENFSDYLISKNNILDKTSENLLHMTQGSISDKEYGSAMNAYDSIEKFRRNIEELYVLTSISSFMINAQDKKVVKTFLLIKCRNIEENGSKTIEKINITMSSVKQTAIIEELKKTRDLTSEIVRAVEFCKK